MVEYFLEKIKGRLPVSYCDMQSPLNVAENFSTGFAKSGIIVNARIVGGIDVIKEKVQKLWAPGMKLIVVTYCKTPGEQEQAYKIIHEICR